MTKGLAFALLGLLLWASPTFAAAPVLFNVGSCLITTPVAPATNAVLTIPPNPQNLLGAFPVNLQTGPSYAIVANDRCKFVKLSNAGAVAISLPGTVLPAGWLVFLEDRGAAGGTITPGAGLIEGAATFPVVTNVPYIIFSDGSNYHVFGGAAATCGTNGQICYNNGGLLGGFTMSGACTIDTSTGVITCTIPVSSLGSIGANTYLGNPTSGSAAPSATAVASCSGSNHASQYTTNTGFTCAPDITNLDVADQSVTGGANMTSLSQSAGNITVDCGARPGQYIANTGAFTITAPAADGYCYLDVENGAGAGAITLSGFSPNTMGGATVDTTNGHIFRLAVSRVHGHSNISAVALQ